MGNIFFTSDCHFSHANIIKYCNRPFKDIIEMNDTLIHNWNIQVSNNDLVFYLGDLMWGKSVNDLNTLISKLNGKIILIKGNHDNFTDQQYLNAGIVKVYDLLETKILNYYFVLCHYQMMFWDRSHYGSFHLYGHQHDKKQYNINQLAYKSLGISERKMNVCIDSNNYQLFSIQEIIDNLKNRPTNWWGEEKKENS